MCGGEKGERGRDTHIDEGWSAAGWSREAVTQYPDTQANTLWTFPAGLCGQMLYLSSLAQMEQLL